MGANNRKLAVSVVENVVDTKHIKRQDRTWDSLIANLAAPKERAAKRDLPLLKLVAFGDKPNSKGSLRHNDNVVSVSGLVGDYDAGTVALDEAEARLRGAGIEAFLHTTPSHMQDGKGPRWRVLARLSVDTSPEQHAALMDRLNGALGGILASESWSLSQVFYVGKVRGVTYETRHIEGQCIDHVEGITPIGKRGGSAEPTVADPEEPIYEPEPSTAPRQPISDVDADQLEHWRARLEREDPDMSEPQWWETCARLVESSGGSDEAYEIFDNWSAKGTKYKGPEDTRKKWDETCSRPPVANPATMEQLGGVATVKDFGPPLDPDVLAAASAVEKQVKLAAFEWRDPEWIMSQPDPVWIVYGLIPQSHDLVFFAGVPGVGKSFLALHAALAIVRGVDWFGADTEQGNVCYIAAEAFGTFNTRLRAYAKHHGLTAREIKGFKLLGAGVNLADAERMKLLGESARAFSPRLLVVDTLAAAAGGIDHNSSEMQKVIDGCKHLQRATGATVLMVAHHGKDESKGIMGWQGLTGNAETICVITKDEEKQAQTRYFKVHKQRNGIEGVSYKWMLEAVALGQDAKGREIASAVPRYLGVGAKKPKARLGANEQLVFDIVMEHDGELTEAELIERVIVKLPPPEEGKEDRRRYSARRAIGSLVREKRAIVERAGKLGVSTDDPALASPDELES